MALTSVTELQTLIADKISQAQQRPSIETVTLTQAVGRVLAERVISTWNIPNADISAMDGYALPAAALSGSQWQIVGESVAGAAFSGSVPENGCVRIMTGARVPADCCCVVLQENTRVNDGRITLTQDVAEHANIRFAGEEVNEGNEVLGTGRILLPADVMLLAAIGLGEVAVYRKIKVAILSTGNELREPGSPIDDGEHIYDSNRHTLMARLRDLPVDVLDLGRIKDDLEDVLRTLDEAAHMADVLITSGGLSFYH